MQRKASPILQQPQSTPRSQACQRCLLLYEVEVETQQAERTKKMAATCTAPSNSGLGQQAASRGSLEQQHMYQSCRVASRIACPAARGPSRSGIVLCTWSSGSTSRAPVTLLMPCMDVRCSPSPPVDGADDEPVPSSWCEDSNARTGKPQGSARSPEEHREHRAHAAPRDADSSVCTDCHHAQHCSSSMRTHLLYWGMRHHNRLCCTDASGECGM